MQPAMSTVRTIALMVKPLRSMAILVLAAVSRSVKLPSVMAMLLSPASLPLKVAPYLDDDATERAQIDQIHFHVDRT